MVFIIFFSDSTNSKVVSFSFINTILLLPIPYHKQKIEIWGYETGKNAITIDLWKQDENRELN